MNKKELNRKLNKMRSTVLVIDEKLQDYFRQEGYSSNNINPIFVRNVVYINSIVDSIDKNLTSISKLKEVDDSNKAMVQKKFATSTYLMKYLLNITTSSSIIDNDYEIHNLILRKNNMPSVLTNIPKKYREVVKEEFVKIGKDRKVIEGFSLKPITKFFSSIGKGFMNIIRTLGRIGKFIGSTLVNFIKFLFKLIKFIAKLVFVYLPRLIKKTAYFIKDLVVKTVKVGLISVCILVFLILCLLKYWQLVLETLMPPLPLVLLPAVLVTLYLFWYQTPMLYKLQIKILKGVLNFFTGPLKEFSIAIFGLNRNDRFFRYRIGRRPTVLKILKKAKLFMLMIAKNMANIIARLLIGILALKYLIKYSVLNVSDGIPNLKDFLLFPVIIVRIILSTILSIF